MCFLWSCNTRYMELKGDLMKHLNVIMLTITAAAAALTPSAPVNAQVRNAAAAGRFYPSDRQELSTMIDRFLEQAPPVTVNGRVRVIWTPHAGYMFSGQIAANAYKSLTGKGYD